MTFFLQDVNGCQALLRKLYGFLSLFFVVNCGKGHGKSQPSSFAGEVNDRTRATEEHTYTPPAHEFRAFSFRGMNKIKWKTITV
jgi:hypothetical protein